MQTVVEPLKSTETRLEWWAYMFVLDEFIGEADATINGPAAYNNMPPALSRRDQEFLLSVIENPPEPSEYLIAAFAEYHRSKKLNQ